MDFLVTPIQEKSNVVDRKEQNFGAINTCKLVECSKLNDTCLYRKPTSLLLKSTKILCIHFEERPIL